MGYAKIKIRPLATINQTLVPDFSRMQQHSYISTEAGVFPIVFVSYLCGCESEKHLKL